VAKSTSSTPHADEITEFPVFQRALLKYFPLEAIDLIEKYHLVGESSIEFSGLLDEVQAAIADPAAGADFLNETLGTALSPVEAEEMLIEFHDQLTKSGIFSDEYAEAEAEKAAAEKASTEELVGYYITRRIELKGPLARFSAPIWVYPAIGVAVAAVMAILMGFIPQGMPGGEILRGVMVAFIIVAVIVVFASAVAMNGLRSERLHPERERERERAYQESLNGDRKKSRRPLRSKLNPFK